MGEMARALIEKHWNGVAKKDNSKKFRLRWWESPTIIRHINKTICGEYIDGWNAGALRLLKHRQGGYETAISIGCGEGTKEMMLLESDLVQKFVCFELAKERIIEGRQLAEKKGLQDRILFVYGDFFTSKYSEQSYDMVFWDNSLHHMMDAHKAVKKTYEILKPGGVFFCNDFVGKSKFQWSDMELAIVNGIRMSLDEKIFQKSNGEIYKRLVSRPSIDSMNRSDPSEAADSNSILPAIREVFANPIIIPTGGLVYHLCLNGILSNIEEESALLKHLLDMDDETIGMGLSQYAFALAYKDV